MYFIDTNAVYTVDSIAVIKPSYKKPTRSPVGFFVVSTSVSRESLLCCLLILVTLFPGAREVPQHADES